MPASRARPGRTPESAERHLLYFGTLPIAAFLPDDAIFLLTSQLPGVKFYGYLLLGMCGYVSQASGQVKGSPNGDVRYQSK